VGVNIDTGAVPDTDVLMQCLRDGFDEVLAVGSRSGHAFEPSLLRPVEPSRRGHDR
jgi:hypothetical protein